MKRVVLLDYALPDLTPERRVAEAHEAEFVALQCPPEGEAVEAAKASDVVLSQGAHYPVTARIISATKEGGYILKYGAGFDNVDVKAAAKQNVKVTNLPDGTTAEVAEHAAALILCQLRRLFQYSESMRSGQWNPTLDYAPIRPFSDVTIGFVGYGRIGQLTHRKLRSLGFRFAAYDPYLDPALVPEDIVLSDLQTLARNAQVLSLHLGATPETIGLVDKELLENLGPEGFVVNTSRGAIINEDDLFDVLTNGTIAGAALDAFVTEPLPANSRFRTCPNLQIGPHAAYCSSSSNERVQLLLSQELDRALSGEPVRCLVS